MDASALGPQPVRPPDHARAAIAVALAGTMIVGGLTLLQLRQVSRVEVFSGTPYVTTFRGDLSTLDKMHARGDGMAFVQLARDPTLSHPEAFEPAPSEAAYRAQRPLLPYAAWLVTLGMPPGASTAVAVLSVIGIGIAAGVAALLLARRRALPLAGLAVIVMPGTLDAMRWFGADGLALALGLAGVALWQRRGSQRAATRATLAFIGAALARETSLLIPLILVAMDRKRWSRSHAALALAPALTWGAWITLVRVRVGAWPWDGSGGRIDLPFRGIVRSASAWEPALATAVVLIIGLALLVAALRLAPRDPLTIIAATYWGLAPLLGARVWTDWGSFSRVLLPAYAAAGIAALGGLRTRGLRSSNARPAGSLDSPGSIARP